MTKGVAYVVPVAELTGTALDWAVNKCLGGKWGSVDSFIAYHEDENDVLGDFHYSTNWAQGGPIIEREKLDLWWCIGNGFYTASNSGGKSVEDGPTPLIAAMRCYVASKLGAEIEIPSELL